MRLFLSLFDSVSYECMDLCQFRYFVTVFHSMRGSTTSLSNNNSNGRSVSEKMKPILSKIFSPHSQITYFHFNIFFSSWRSAINSFCLITKLRTELQTHSIGYMCVDVFMARKDSKMRNKRRWSQLSWINAMHVQLIYWII